MMSENQKQAPIQFIKPDAAVFVAIPTHSGTICDKLAGAMIQATRKGNIAKLSTTNGSVLTRNFNMSLAVALNNREKLSHLCIVHGDIEILKPFWLDTMLEIMAREKADILSVVSPIKTMEGFTSTAIDEPTSLPHWSVKRLTLHEIFKDYPATFTHPKILLNTALMLIDLGWKGIEKCYFAFEDKLVKDKDGKFHPVGVSEDWVFSRQARALGARMFATREIQINHVGSMRFGNTEPWGDAKTDEVTSGQV